MRDRAKEKTIQSTFLRVTVGTHVTKERLDKAMFNLHQCGLYFLELRRKEG